jgi:hypothetical protein
LKSVYTTPGYNNISTPISAGLFHANAQTGQAIERALAIGRRRIVAYFAPPPGQRCQDGIAM